MFIKNSKNSHVVSPASKTSVSYILESRVFSLMGTNILSSRRAYITEILCKRITAKLLVKYFHDLAC